MDLSYKTQIIEESKKVSVYAPYCNILNQTDKPQTVKINEVAFVLQPLDSLSFPESGISPNMMVKQSFDIVFTSSESEGKLILTTAYFNDVTNS